LHKAQQLLASVRTRNEYCSDGPENTYAKPTKTLFVQPSVAWLQKTPSTIEEEADVDGHVAIPVPPYDMNKVRLVMQECETREFCKT